MKEEGEGERMSGWMRKRVRKGENINGNGNP